MFAGNSCHRQKILDLFARICDVIHFAHQNLIIHRDLKPSNIYITPDGDIKLLDFGIATLADPDSGEGHVRTGLNFFSLTYASPEQISGRPVTTATDTYALGVLLYVLLSGKVPYTTEDKTPRLLSSRLSVKTPLYRRAGRWMKKTRAR